MRQGLVWTVSIATFLLFATPSLSAHGGNYRGPGDLVPPNLGGPGDTSPPGNVGGPTTPGPGSLTPGGATRPGTGGVTAPGGSATGPRAVGPLTGRRSRATTGFERWEFWWEHNKEPFLNLRNALNAQHIVTGEAGFLSGRALREAAVSNARLSASDVKNQILPNLRDALGETHPDIVDSSALGLGRILVVEDADLVVDDLLATIGHQQKTAREAATLALGVLGSSHAVPPLLDLLSDTPSGRQLSGRTGEVENLVRAFAATSLGLIGDTAAIKPLMNTIRDRSITSADIKSMAILALGQFQECHDEIVPFLTSLMTDRSLARTVRAQAPIALGSLHARSGHSLEARATLDANLAMFNDDKTDFDMTRSLAVSFGELATIEDAAIIDSLLKATQTSSDDQTRSFSIMALAQIGARDDAPQDHRELHDRLERFFLGELARPERRSHTPYGALGLAVYARNAAHGDIVRDRAGRALIDAFEDQTNPSWLGAMAIGLGLIDHQRAQQVLWEKFDDSNDQALKGNLALALGMLRDKSRAEAFRDLIQKEGLEPRFTLQLARSLGLMGDARAVDVLIDRMQSSGTLSEAASAAQALGLIGDSDAIDPLVTLLQKGESEQARGLAAVALGILADKRELPWNWVFSVNSNYRAKTAALAEILDLL